VSSTTHHTKYTSNKKTSKDVGTAEQQEVGKQGRADSINSTAYNSSTDIFLNSVM